MRLRQGLGMADDATSREHPGDPVPHRLAHEAVHRDGHPHARAARGVVGERPDLRLRGRLPRWGGRRSRSSTCWDTPRASPSSPSSRTSTRCRRRRRPRPSRVSPTSRLAFAPGASFTYRQHRVHPAWAGGRARVRRGLRGLPPGRDLRAAGHDGLGVRGRRHPGPGHRLRVRVQRGTDHRWTCPSSTRPAACTRRARPAAAGILALYTDALAPAAARTRSLLPARGEHRSRPVRVRVRPVQAGPTGSPEGRLPQWWHQPSISQLSEVSGRSHHGGDPDQS